MVAALNLGSVELLRRDIGRAIARVRLPGAAPGPGGQTWPRLLRELAWILFGATLAVSVTLAVLGLVEAGTVDAAVRSALVLLLAAAVGVVAGQMSGRHQLAQLASGAAALAVIGSASRVNALALPEYTLVLTAAVAATIALGSGLLPPSARQGPGLGSLFGAALTAAVVLVTVAKSVLATIQASITPAVWAADIAALPGQVHIANWQVPAAAVLIAIVGVAAAPPGWRVDALVGGAFVVTLALPGTGTLAWWAIPLVAWAVSTVVISAALVAGTGRSTGVRAGVAGLLGLYALGTSLPRAELTAAVATLLFLVAAGITVVGAGSPHRLGPYAHRVADSAGGAAAFTLPVAVGTFAWLAGAAGAVLVPLTLLAIAVGVFGAALSQAVASTPRTGGVGGALGAAAGGLVLAVRADGAELADIGLAVLLLVAAAVGARDTRIRVVRRWTAGGRGRYAGRVRRRAGRTAPAPRDAAGRWPDGWCGARHRCIDHRDGPGRGGCRAWHRPGDHHGDGARCLGRGAGAARCVATWATARRGRGWWLDPRRDRQHRPGRGGPNAGREHAVLACRPRRVVGPGGQLCAVRLAGAGEPAARRGRRLCVAARADRRRYRLRHACPGRAWPCRQ